MTTVARGNRWVRWGLLLALGAAAVGLGASAPVLAAAKTARAPAGKGAKGTKSDKAAKGDRAAKAAAGAKGGKGAAAAKASKAKRGSHATKAGRAAQGTAGKAAKGKDTDAKAAGGHSDAKASPAQQSRQDAALRKRCAAKGQAKTAACKAFAKAERQRDQDEADAKLAKRCSTAKARKTAACKRYVKQHAGSGRDACGRKYARAKKNEPVARFAKRHGLTEAALRRLNDLPDKTKKLRGGARYLVAKSPHDGVTLSGGVQLTDERGVIRLRRPHLAYGKPMLVSVIEEAAAAVQASSPLGVTLMVGDLSKEGGGCLPPHKSHRGGLDADIGFYFRGAFEPKVLADAQADTIDADRTWQFLRGLLATGRLQYAFIHYDLQPPLLEAALRAGETPESAARLIQYPRPIEQARETPIRHLDGHDDHMHVRFACADEPCELSADEKAAIAQLRLETLGGPVGERHATGLHSPLRQRRAPRPPLR